MDVDVRIGKSRIIKDATCFRAGLWRFLVWSDQKTLLPFMRRATEVSLVYNKIDEVVANQKSYEEVFDFTGLFPGSFFQNGTVCYLIPFDYEPPWSFPIGLSGNISIGLTTGSTFFRDGVAYRGGLDYYPAVKESVDNIEAAKMKFNSGSVTLDNTDGFFDNAYSFFGNGFKVFMRDGEDVMPLYEYYIKDISMTLDSVTFSLGDKRERLSQKIPAEKFTAEKYPDMMNTDEAGRKSGYLGKTIPAAYGYCQNIPAICVDEFKIFVGDATGPLKPDRTFKVCQRIISIDSVMVKMTQPSENSGAQEVWVDQFKMNHILSIDYANGMFTMNRQYCMPEIEDKKTVPEMFEVMVTGIFGLPESDCTPGKILAEIMGVYGGVSFGPSHYNIEEFNAELAPLAKIGFYLDKEQDLFNVIETLQNGSDYSFQFMTDFDRFTAKRNDDERPVKMRIAQNDILNPSEIEYSANTGEYATVVDIGYNMNYQDGVSERLVNKDNRDAILYLYKIEKAYQADALLYDKNDVKSKVSRLAKHFSEPRPMISNITLFGKKWFYLACYDIIDIDLRVNERGESHGNTVVRSLAEGPPTRYVMGVENAGRRTFITQNFDKTEKIRPFIGRITGKIAEVEKNVKDETVKISVIKMRTLEKDESDAFLRIVDSTEISPQFRRVDGNSAYLEELRRVETVYDRR